MGVSNNVGLYLPEPVRLTVAAIDGLQTNLTAFNRALLHDDRLHPVKCQTAHDAVAETNNFMGIVGGYLKEERQHDDVNEGFRIWKEIKTSDAISGVHEDKGMGTKVVEMTMHLMHAALDARKPLFRQGEPFQHFMAAELHSLEIDISDTLRYSGADKVQALAGNLDKIVKGGEVPYYALAASVAGISGDMAQVWGGGKLQGEDKRNADQERLISFAKNVMEAAASRVMLPGKPSAENKPDPRNMELV